MTKAAIFNKYPIFIHGEARGENDEFVLHCRYPRFLARRSFDETFSDGLPSAPINGEIGKTQKGQLAYDSGVGIWFSAFIFFDARPADEAEFVEALLSACNRAAADTFALDDDAGTSMGDI